MFPSLEEHSWINSLLIAVVGGGGFAGWMRERRKAKASEADTMLQFVDRWGEQFNKQNDRIDQLNRDIGVLTGRLTQMSEHNTALVTENTALKSEVMRLETALQVEVTKATTLAALPRDGRRTDMDLTHHFESHSAPDHEQATP